MKLLQNESLRLQYMQSEYVSSHFPDSILPHFSLREYMAGEDIITQAQCPEGLFILVKGRCRVSELLPNGKSIILRTDRPFCMFGEVEILDEDHAALSVTAIDDSLLLCLPAPAVRSILLKDARFLLALCREISERSARSVDRLFMRSAYPVKNQAAFFILDNLHHNEFTIRKSEMADSLGVTYRHIERIMDEFVKADILQKNKRTYSVKNKSALEILSENIVSIH